MMEKLDKWHKSRTGLAVYALVELLIAYVFASFSIDSGSWWDYLVTLIFLIGALQNFFKLLKGFSHGNHKRS
jgi:hypothetical protein